MYTHGSNKGNNILISLILKQKSEYYTQLIMVKQKSEHYTQLIMVKPKSEYYAVYYDKMKR